MNNTNEALEKMAGLVTANTKSISMLGARVMVLGRFFEAVLPHLTKSQCLEVNGSFRQGIEDAMSLMDDIPLPADYHFTLLELTNVIQAALSQASAARV